MFSLEEKQKISDAVQKILKDTKHPELPKGEISFQLNVKGAESWSWADILNNGHFTKDNPPEINQWNEQQDHNQKEK